MKLPLHHYKFVLLLCSLVWGLFSLVAGQYYYFDSATSTSPYQQWCAEDLNIRINTQANPYGARAGLFRLLLDPLHFSYSTSSLASVLQTNLFVASTETFSFNTSPWSSPSWIDPGTYTQLQIDRNNSSTDYKWSNGLYGTVKFTPLYNTSTYTGTFSMIYNGDTVRTSLSKAWGTNIIDPAHQTTYLTGYYPILQKPCTDDTTSPGVSIPYPTQGSTKQSYVSGISLILTDNAWSAVGVPFVRTGDVPGVGIWTWNLWSTTNQYGINLSSFHIWISGNGTGKYFTGDWFSLWGPLSATPNAKTWQYFDKNYTLHIPSSQLFDFGVEQPITITGRVYDRNNNGPVTFTRTFNAPVQPWLIAGSASPAAGDSLVATNAPILLWIADDRAGVNSWSIIITLSGSNYWPYIFSGTDLNLSGVQGTANHPDYYLSLINHPPFASSGTIQVIIDAQDMVGNVDNISNYTFSTKPSCTDLWCCQDIYIQTGNNLPLFYNGFTLHISWGVNPTFDVIGNTGIVNCNTPHQWMTIYKWIEEQTGSANHISFFDLPHLIFSWFTIQATLSWHTIYLQRMLTVIVKAFPSNRIYQTTNNTNTWILKIYDTDKTLIATSSRFTLNAAGTGKVNINIPVGTYYVVFKGQSHLASYISWVLVAQNWGLFFDFTTGADLYGTQQLNDAEDDGYRYQTAWDLANTNGEYDFIINGNDIAILTQDGLQEWGIDVLDPRNLNGDTAINTSDISVIWVNFEKKDPYFADNSFFNW